MNKFFFFFLTFFGFLQAVSAQNSRYAVEVGAFAEGVDLSYFRKLDYTVYESVDVNTIFHYYIDVQDESEGARVRETARNAGHKYARIVDFDQIAAQCATQCGYQPRKITQSGNPSTMKIVDNPAKPSRKTTTTTSSERPRKTSTTIEPKPSTATNTQTDPNPRPQRTPKDKKTNTNTTATTNPSNDNTQTDPTPSPKSAPRKYKTVFDKEAGKYIRVYQD